MAATLFAPGYLGGWTACEHWGPTDQVFSDLAVYTTRRVRHREPVIQDVTYQVRVIPAAKLFGPRRLPPSREEKAWRPWNQEGTREREGKRKHAGRSRRGGGGH